MHCPDIVPGVAPIALGIQVSQWQFRSQTKLNPRHAMRDFASDKLKAATGAFVIEKNAVTAGYAIGFPVIQGEVKASYLADAIGASGMKRGVFPLRRLLNLAEHFARPGEVKAALRLQFPQSLQYIMRAVDVRPH